MAKVRVWRMCPECENVLPAGRLFYAWRKDEFGKVLRNCPICGFVGVTSDFVVIKPAEEDLEWLIEHVEEQLA